MTLNSSSAHEDGVEPSIIEVPPESVDPSATNATRSRDAIRKLDNARALEATLPDDPCARAFQRHQAQVMHREGAALLEPGRLVAAAGEAVPALGFHETTGRRDTLVDTLERPTTIAVRASEQRVALLEKLDLLQSGLDLAQTADAANSIEKVLCHQLAAAHSAAMRMLRYLPGEPETTNPALIAQVARCGNTAARLMEVSAALAMAIQKLKTGGTQRVVVQHQQVVVAQQVPSMVINPPRRSRRRGARTGGTP